jgi:AraC-like DNA-binding protein
MIPRVARRSSRPGLEDGGTWLKTRSSKLDIELVREEIIHVLSTGKPALRTVAGALRISPRTLQRRLAEQGFNFRSLVNETRFLTARRLISERYRLSEVACRLGYADAGSFTRAFERWTGITPQKYRSRFGRVGSALGYKAKY